MTSVLYFLMFVLVAFLIYRGIKNESRILQNNWSQYYSGMRISTKEFYNRLELELDLYEVPELYTQEVSLSEGGLMSDNRLYLRISWKEFQYDLCVAPFGNSDTFVSWWLWRTPSFWESVFGRIPKIGMTLSQMVSPTTYYKIDSANAFMTFTQSKVLKILDEIIAEQKITALPEYERYPIKLASTK